MINFRWLFLLGELRVFFFLLRIFFFLTLEIIFIQDIGVLASVMFRNSSLLSLCMVRVCMNAQKRVSPMLEFGLGTDSSPAGWVEP